MKYFITSLDKKVGTQKTKIVDLHSYSVRPSGWNTGKITMPGIYCVRDLYGELYIRVRETMWERYYVIHHGLDVEGYIYIGTGESIRSDSVVFTEEVKKLEFLFREKHSIDAFWNSWSFCRWWKKLA